MSLSSAATLISPHTGRTPSTSTGPNTAALQRRGSTHSAHPVKRRASQHHSHGHHSHSSAGSRRGSEGEQGRRAVVAGLTMHVLDGAGSSSRGTRRQSSREKRPLAKNSRSETHLPTLSRTHSMTSTTSHSSTTSTARKRPGKTPRAKSDESVRVLDEDGQEAGEVDAEEDGWESGDGEDAGSGKKARDTTRGNPPIRESTTMRRSKSDTHAETASSRTPHQPDITAVLGGNQQLVETPQETPFPPPLTQRTTGFAGTLQDPDPEVVAQLPHPDPHPIATPNPLKKSASSRSLVGPVAFEGFTKDGGLATEPPMADKLSKPRIGPHRLRSTDGSGLPSAPDKEASTSPSYPFPQMVPPETDLSTSPRTLQHSSTAAPDPAAATAQAPTKASAPAQPTADSSSVHSASEAPSAAPRARQPSGPPGSSSLRHRYSNSSLRSIQSLRAPPHPLNSPTAYRVQGSRPGSMFGSPSRDDRRQRVPSMHQPPVPQPQVSYEIAQGQGWDEIQEEPGASRPSRTPAARTVRSGSKSLNNRAISGIFAGAGAGSSGSGPTISNQTAVSSQPASRSVSSASQVPQPHRRRTALEAASAASKLSTTTDPVEYHQSLGYSSNSAETCFLVSRFLPMKKAPRPKWEVNGNMNASRDPDDPESSYFGSGSMGIGLTNGDYREAHESLIRTLRELDLNAANPASSSNSGPLTGASGSGGGGLARRAMSRSYSGYALAPSNNASAASASMAQEESSGPGLGLISRKDGQGLMVVKGGFRGRTPFEMSVERCLAQRPGRLALAKLDG